MYKLTFLSFSDSHPSRLEVDSTVSIARQRRSRRRANKELLPSQSPRPLPSSQSPAPGLEDSTDGVASILKKKLQQLELDEKDRRRNKKVVVTGVEEPPLASMDRNALVISHASDEGHSSDVGTQTDFEDEEEEEGGGGVTSRDGVKVKEGRPLPPPMDPSSDEGRIHNSVSTPTNSTDITGITLHGTDELRASVFLTHPSVQVSIMDVLSGALLKKSTPEKCVASFYERGNPSVDYIMPVMTRPYECRKHRIQKGILKAQWEETLIFNEFLSYFTSNQNVIIFFELLDFVSGGSGKGYTNRMQSVHKPWHRIAWAFLFPSGKTCSSKLGQKIRLQLYKYPKNVFGHSTESAEVFRLWSKRYRSTYPSTLYITVEGVSTALPQEDPTTRSLFPLQEEKGSITFEQMVQLQMASKSFTGLTGVPSSTLMSASLRLPGQACQIPTTRLSILYPTPMGASTLAFSHTGHLLAVGCADQDNLYPLVIYEIPSFKPVMVTEGHRGIIYQFCWNRDDKLLASISADGIVKLWCLDGGLTLKPTGTMPHPCYVYCACFLTGTKWEEGNSNVLATGAYDSYVRIWSFSSSSSSSEESSTQMIGEFRGDSGHINCLVWSAKAALLYAGDSNGVLGVWHQKEGAWWLKHKADILNGQSLVAMNLHPNGRKMLLHTRKAKLVMLDLRINQICREYVGIEPSSVKKCTSLLSPCGGLVFASSPGGTVHVWNTDTGKALHEYCDLPFTTAVGAMAYHPTEHMLILSSFGTFQPLMALHHIVGSQPPVPTPAAPPPALTMAIQKSGSGGAFSSTMALPGVVEEDTGGGEREERNRTEFLESQVRGSQRFRDLVNTLSRVAASKDEPN